MRAHRRRALARALVPASRRANRSPSTSTERSWPSRSMRNPCSTAGSASGSADLIRTRPLDSGFNATTEMTGNRSPETKGGSSGSASSTKQVDVEIPAVNRAALALRPDHRLGPAGVGSVVGSGRLKQARTGSEPHHQRRVVDKVASDTGKLGPVERLEILDA